MKVFRESVFKFEAVGRESVLKGPLQTFVRSLELVFGYIDLKLYIHKKGAKHSVSNFRPISLVPFINYLFRLLVTAI